MAGPLTSLAVNSGTKTKYQRIFFYIVYVCIYIYTYIYVFLSSESYPKYGIWNRSAKNIIEMKARELTRTVFLKFHHVGSLYKGWKNQINQN
jgi:hypothetical protein